MRRGVGWAERLFRLCLLAYPEAQRRAHGQALVETFADQLTAARPAAVWRRVALVVAECANAVANGVRWRWSDAHEPASSRRPAWDAILLDVRFGFRTFRRQPGFALSAVLLLGVGIGACTAAVSLVNAYLLRSLPFPGAERLVTVAPLSHDAPLAMWETVPREIWQIEWPQRADIIEEFVTWDLDAFTLIGEGRPEVLSGAWVVPGYFRIQHTVPALGRLIGEADVTPGAPPVAVIGYALWQRQFGGDSTVIGRTVTAYTSDRPFDAETFTIVGVLPPDYWFLNSSHEFLAPLVGPRMPYLLRLAPGVSPERAAAHLTGVVRGSVANVDPAWPGVHVVSAHEEHVAAARPALLVMIGAVTLVLLIACANVALLLAVRALARRRELSVRRALGASRGRVVRQLCTEGVLLAAIAGALGITIAAVTLGGLAPAIQEHLGATIPGGTSTVGIDPVVLAAALALSATTGLLFAVVPAVVGSRGDPAPSLGGRAGGVADGARHRGWRGLVIGVELAVSLALLIGASLTIRSAIHLHRVELGFETDDVLTAAVSLRRPSYTDPQQLNDLTQPLLRNFGGASGIRSASFLTGRPFSDRTPHPVIPDHQPESVYTGVLYTVTPGYVESMSIPIRSGRAFEESDRPGAEPVTILSEAMARALWPDGTALGRRIRLAREGPDAVWRRVVGIVGDVRETLMGTQSPDVYVPYAQRPRVNLFVVAKLTGPAGPAVTAMRDALWRLDPDAALTQVVPLEERVGWGRTRPQFLAAILTGFGGFAVVLAVAGLYSTIAYTVGRQRRDVAVRIALGAGAARVTRQYLRQASAVVGAGLAGGLGASLLLSRVLASQLHGITPLDPPAFAAASALLGAAALVAVWIPARRAAETDPMTVLRQD